jgi:2-aminoadipate transaminase
MPPAFKQWITHLQTARTERLLKYAANSEVISFAGGLPAEELFPAAEIEAAFQYVIREHAAEALQYTWSEGCEPLRERIVDWLHEHGLSAKPAQILVTHGAQQALDLLAKLYIHPGDAMVIESPTYVPAIQAFELQGPRFVSVTRTSTGLDMGQLEARLRFDSARLMYVIPCAHNPTGGTLDVAQRSDLLEVAQRFNLMLIEDAAYADIRYGAFHPPLAAIDSNLKHVVLVGSFSKVLSPGLRIGWIFAAEEVIRQLALIKQASDLQTGTLNQLVLARYLEEHSLRSHVKRCLSVYRSRRNAALSALAAKFPAASYWSVPAGGFSIWVGLPPSVSSEELLKAAVARGVAFEPGLPFFPEHKSQNYLRLSFSNLDEASIREGLTRLGGVVKESLSPTPQCPSNPRASAGTSR